MLDLEKLALLVSSRMGPLLAEHQRCSRVRSPLSKCSRCMSLCPVDALSFDQEGIGIADTCLECGLCAGVCPTSALAIQEPTEPTLLNKLMTIGEQGGTVVLGCRRQVELNPRGFSVPCLGSLSWECLLTLEQAPFPIYLVLALDKCKQCLVTGGGEHCIKQLEEVRKISQNLVLKKGAIRFVSKAPHIKAPRRIGSDPDRRAFFRSVFTGAKQIPWVMLQSVLEQNQQEDTSLKAMSGIKVSRLSILKQALASRKDSGEQLALLQRPILQATCHFCRACTVLCPVGALQCTDEYQLMLNAGRCSGCGLCTEICLHHSLALAPSIIADFCQDETLLIAQGMKGRCNSCGQEMIASETKEYCFICEKKAGWQAM